MMFDADYLIRYVMLEDQMVRGHLVLFSQKQRYNGTTNLFFSDGYSKGAGKSKGPPLVGQL